MCLCACLCLCYGRKCQRLKCERLKCESSRMLTNCQWTHDSIHELICACKACCDWCGLCEMQIGQEEAWIVRQQEGPPRQEGLFLLSPFYTCVCVCVCVCEWVCACVHVCVWMCVCVNPATEEGEQQKTLTSNLKHIDALTRVTKDPRTRNTNQSPQNMSQSPTNPNP